MASDVFAPRSGRNVCPKSRGLGEGMALFFCYIIAYIQILSAGFNLWGVDPLILFNTPVGRNTIFVGLFQLVQVLGLVGAILTLQKVRLGFVLSIFHHILLLPALVITNWGMVMLMDDRINVTLLVMSKPSGLDFGTYWSLGWNTVFQQVTPTVPRGASYFGINLFAFVCFCAMCAGMSQAYPARAERDMAVRRRPRPAPARRPQLALPPPEHYAREEWQNGPRPQRPRPPNGARPQRMQPPNGVRQAPRPYPR